MLRWIILVTLCWSVFTASFAVDPDPAPTPKLRFTFDDKEWVLPLEQVGFDGIDPTTSDRRAFFRWIHQNVEPEVNQTPRSCFFHEGTLVPHRTGQVVDRKKLDDWLDQIHPYLNQPVQLPMRYREPQFQTFQCQRLKEKHLSSYTTLFNPRNENRSHNIRLSTQAIDHVIVFPGQTFSFNQVVGQRTVKKGYRMAKVIVKGEYSEGVGGGICQTSSTLFNSVDQVGLEIIERISHSKRVTYIPEKRDATVSWGGPDFRFKNQLNEPILVVAKVNGGRLTISVYGPKSIMYKSKKISHKSQATRLR